MIMRSQIVQQSVLLCCACALLCQESLAQLKLLAKEPPAEMETLEFLVGAWKKASGEWHDLDGQPLKIERGEGVPDDDNVIFEISPIMGGLYLEGGAESTTVRSYFFYHDREQKYFHLALDFMGSMSLMSGHWQGDTLQFVDIAPQKRPGEGKILWRRKFFNIKDRAYTFTYEFSKDEGKTWRLRGRQTMERVQDSAVHQIPHWLLDDWARRTQGTGIWIADNSAYRSDASPYDAYGLQWEYGLGKKHLKGRLYCIKEGKDVGTVWQFTEFWDPAAGKVRIVQLGSDGTVGQGALWLMANGRLKEQQTFVGPDGGSLESGHEVWIENGEQHTQSFNILNGKWHKRRFYIWKPKDNITAVDAPDEYRSLAYLIGQWQSSFGDRRGRMTFTWGENKRNIQYRNHYQPGKDQPWVQENEGMISYHAVRDQLVFLTSYSGKRSHLMAEGHFEIADSGSIVRLFTCHYKGGDTLPWSGEAVAPAGGKSIEFKQVWTPVDDDTFHGDFYWKQDGKWVHPIKDYDKQGFEEVWKRVK